jgi:hypothetical protein
MTDEEEREWALKEADRMRIMASQVKQCGFIEYARWLRKNADNAMKWAARPYENQSSKGSAAAHRRTNR